MPAPASFVRSNFSWVGIALQSAYGTPTIPTLALPIAGGDSIEPQWDILYNEAPDGFFFDMWKVKRSQFGQGDITFYLHPDLLSALSGILDPVDDNQPPLVTVAVGIGGQFRKILYDARVTSARFSFSRRDLPQVTLTVQGRLFDISRMSFQAPNALTTPPFTRQEILLALGTALQTLTFGSTNFANYHVQSVEINFDFNPVDPNELVPFGDISPIDIITTVIRVTGNITLNAPRSTQSLIDSLIADESSNADDFALGVRCARGTNAITITIPRASRERLSFNTSGDKTSMEQASIDWRALAYIQAGTVRVPYSITLG
ncbi:MAG: phage tail tube protein [Nitrososphaerota archaeon]